MAAPLCQCRHPRCRAAHRHRRRAAARTDRSERGGVPECSDRPILGRWHRRLRRARRPGRAARREPAPGQKSCGCSGREGSRDAISSIVNG